MRSDVLAILISLSCFGLTGCIGDDIVEDEIQPIVRILSTIDTLGRNDSFQINGVYFNEIGIEQTITKTWVSSNPSTIEVNSNGYIYPKGEGTATITASFNSISDSIEVTVGDKTTFKELSATGNIAPSSFYELDGDFIITQEGNNVRIQFRENYVASTSLPGLYLYLTNNPTTVNNAKEIGAVKTFRGSHSYLVENTTVNEFTHLLYFCKPFNVKVGDGKINIQEP